MNFRALNSVGLSLDQAVIFDPALIVRPPSFRPVHYYFRSGQCVDVHTRTPNQTLHRTAICLMGLPLRFFFHKSVRGGRFGRLAAFTKRTFPKEGLIDVPYSGVRLRWVIRMTSADADCILSPIEQ